MLLFNTNTNSIHHNYVMIIEDSLSRFYTTNCENTDFEEFLSRYCYVVTLGMNTTQYQKLDSVDATTQKARRTYIHINKRFMNNFQRKPLMQPLFLGCYDIGGTRNGAGLNKSPEYPHVHGIMAIHPQNHDRFLKVLPSLETDLKHMNRDIVDVKIEQYDPEKSSLNRLSSYITKAIPLHYKADPYYVSKYFMSFPHIY